MDMFEQILALTEDRTVRMALALAAVILLILIVATIYRRIARRGLSLKRGRVARLAILEAIPIDQRRRLILLRRDNTEHLVMIGGPTDLVVEEGIHRQARQPANKRPAPERAAPDRAMPDRIAPESTAPERTPPDRPKSDPAEVPRIPIGAPIGVTTGSPADVPKPVSTIPEVTHTPAPAPSTAPKPPTAPVTPITPVIPAAIIADSVLPDSGSTTAAASEPVATMAAPADPVAAVPVEPLEAASDEDPQIADMERKLQDALKAPASGEAETPAEDETTEDLDMPDIDSSLEAAIANAVASDAAELPSDQPGENDSASLSERLENINTGKLPSG